MSLLWGCPVQGNFYSAYSGPWDTPLSLEWIGIFYSMAPVNIHQVGLTNLVRWSAVIGKINFLEVRLFETSNYKYQSVCCMHVGSFFMSANKQKYHNV
jgi:hypothetical protein